MNDSLEIVEPVARPNGDLARCVALVQLEIHVDHNKLNAPSNKPWALQSANALHCHRNVSVVQRD